MCLLLKCIWYQKYSLFQQLVMSWQPESSGVMVVCMEWPSNMAWPGWQRTPIEKGNSLFQFNILQIKFHHIIILLYKRAEVLGVGLHFNYSSTESKGHMWTSKGWQYVLNQHHHERVTVSKKHGSWPCWLPITVTWRRVGGVIALHSGARAKDPHETSPFTFHQWWGTPAVLQREN